MNGIFGVNQVLNHDTVHFVHLATQIRHLTMPSDNSERRNFDCKVTRKTPEGAWDLTGRNAHLIWGVNMGASVIWYDCVTTSGQSSVNNLTDESLEKTQTSDDCEGELKACPGSQS